MFNNIEEQEVNKPKKFIEVKPEELYDLIDKL